MVQYQEGAEGVQAESYASQLDMLKDQKKQLEYLQKSLQEGENHFPEEDKFGYQATFRDYISQAGSLRASTSQQNETIASQNAAASQTQAEIGNSSVKQRLKFAITRQLSQLWKQVLPWPVRI